MTYTEAMEKLAEATAAAYAAAQDAFRAADNEDGAPVGDIEEIKLQLRDMADDVVSLIDHGMTVKEVRSAHALYKGAKLAGLVDHIECLHPYCGDTCGEKVA